MFIVNKQREFFEQGKTLSYESRKQALIKLKNCIRQNEDEIKAALKKDLGKSEFESYMSEIGLFYSTVDYNLKHLKKWMKPKKCGTPLTISPARSKTVASPYGVVLIISPWNYPFLLTLEPLAAALAAGNTCVVKPSELSPETTNVITKVVGDAFPEGLVSFVNGSKGSSKRDRKSVV